MLVHCKNKSIEPLGTQFNEVFSLQNKIWNCSKILAKFMYDKEGKHAGPTLNFAGQGLQPGTYFEEWIFSQFFCENALEYAMENIISAKQSISDHRFWDILRMLTKLVRMWLQCYIVKDLPKPPHSKQGQALVIKLVYSLLYTELWWHLWPPEQCQGWHHIGVAQKEKIERNGGYKSACPSV